MITANVPKTWKELQNKAAEILTKCWLNVEIERIVDSARGKVEIDVYAEESIQSRKNIILIECKFWNKPIPQTVIHSFRTVIWDIGGNIGYIISKNGFQKWAYNAIEYSNVKLVTWEEFDLLFEDSWYENYFTWYITNHFVFFMYELDSLSSEWFSLLTEKSDLERVWYLRNHHRGQDFLLSSLWWSWIFSSSDDRKIKLPLERNIKFKNIPECLLGIKSYEELIKALHNYYDPMKNELSVLKEKAINSSKTLYKSDK